jgi:predicted dinucleotide-utilizing enzyme
MKRRIGLIGHGQIGSYVVAKIDENPDSNFEVAFVFDVDHNRTADLPANLVLKTL